MTGHILSSAIDTIRAARELCGAGAGSILDILLRSSSGSHGDVAGLLRTYGGVEVIDQEPHLTLSLEALGHEVARQLRGVPFRGARGELLVALEDPWNHALVARIGTLLRIPFLPAAARRADIDRWLGSAKTPTLVGSDTGAAATGPVVEFVESCVTAAHHAGASDIHFESDATGLSVKLRLDGVMQMHARLEDAGRAPEVISRIKVLAQLDITERRLPQDGRFTHAIRGAGVDFRVSIMPNVHGEDAVLRLLDKARTAVRDSVISLSSLGFEDSAAQAIHRLASAPSGMLLVTGPTGSGKTTTVYAALSEINSGLEKIVTIEDPVEYDLPGVLQIPVNERKGLTFAKGLRSILRHDPDRILVGEIRDAETAAIAIQSALTGHQVFTTVHANSLFDVIGRFRHFGLDVFGLASALNGVVVQRLVRRLCVQCRTWRSATAMEREWLGDRGVTVDQVPAAPGCPACHRSGYHGRFVIAEVHRLDDALRDLVTSNAALSAVKQHLGTTGISALDWQAARRVERAETTLEEIGRVVGLWH